MPMLTMGSSYNCKCLVHLLLPWICKIQVSALLTESAVVADTFCAELLLKVNWSDWWFRNTHGWESSRIRIMDYIGDLDKNFLNYGCYATFYPEKIKIIQPKFHCEFHCLELHYIILQLNSSDLKFSRANLTNSGPSRINSVPY